MRTSNPLAEICLFFCFFNICVPFPFQNEEKWKCLLASTNVSALCLDFDEGRAILQALHIRALLSMSSGEMTFDSSSCMLKVYFAFVNTMLEFFANYTFCWITSTFAKTNEQNNRDDSFETRHFDEGRPCGEPPCTSLVQRSSMLMQKRPLLSLTGYRVFSHDITEAILASKNNETAAMLVSQTSPLGVELFSYANAFF